MLILAVDAAGQPSKWLGLRAAAKHVVNARVLGIGQTAVHLLGGVRDKSGSRSEIGISSILVMRGRTYSAREFYPPRPNRDMLFHRDRCLCAYCGLVFSESSLTMDHILPAAQGGPPSWMNQVTACARCNGRKGNRTPEKAGMPLLYVPYVPGRNEIFILKNRLVLADQMEFLLAGVPRSSRMHG